MHRREEATPFGHGVAQFGQFGRTAMPFVWILPLVGAGVAAFQLYRGLQFGWHADTAGIALCWAVIPYVAARAIDGILCCSWRDRMLSAVSQEPKSATLAAQGTAGREMR
jgi:hypothetical protein